MAKTAKKTPVKKTTKTTTALARRQAAPAGRSRRPPTFPGEGLMPGRYEVLEADGRPAGTLRDYSTLTEETALGALGLVEIKLTEKEEAVLARPVRVEDVRMKPTGQPYVSHPTYTKWFNDAFGRMGWTLVPKSKPARDGNMIMIPYILYIHGQPAAFAWGEHEYYEANKEQSYGDVIESTYASGLRRCAKRLGVGLELWDREWLDAYIAAHCVRVAVIVKDRGSREKTKKYVWRRKVDPPAWNEVGAAAPDQVEDDGDARVEQSQRRQGAPAERSAPPAHVDNTRGEPIAEPQRRRLYAIIKNSGRNENVVKAWMKTRYGYDGTRDVLRSTYDDICAAIEAAGSLPL